jgi:uncharacterized membrane protein
MTDRARRTTTAVLIGLGVLVLVSACAASGNDYTGTASEVRGSVGFWWGLWHGLIAPITFIVSLFNHSVGIYEVHNDGSWYNFGFLLGLSIIFGGGPGGSCARRRCK